MPRNGSGVFSLPAGSTVANGDTSDATDINTPLADIESDANVARPVVAGGTGATTAADARTNLGLAIGTNVQAYDADLTAIAGLTSAADRLPYYTGAGTAALATFTAAGRALVDDADAAAQRTTLGLVIGTNVQAYDAALASLAGLSLVAGDVIYATGADTFVRLAKGTAGQLLQMNAGATAPEWATVSTTPSTSDVLNATAGLTLGAVGSYAMLQRTASNSVVTADDLIAGASLRYAGFNNGLAANSANGGSQTGASPSGTWRALGTVAANSSQFATTLFVRTV